MDPRNNNNLKKKMGREATNNLITKDVDMAKKEKPNKRN